jgi:hypothetical protein
MRLSINRESVEALREFAEKLPEAIENIKFDTEKLINTYINVLDTVGPHRDEFHEMLLTISRAQEASAEAIKELPYMLKCTADKMESYIMHGSSQGGVLSGNTDIKSRYASAAETRLSEEGTNPIAKELYNEYAGSVRIVDYDFMGTPFYNSISNGIKLNAMADLHNPTGNLSTYFHEVGHMLDDYAGNGHAWLSSDPEYGECLKRDVDAYITKTILTKHCEMTESYDIISEEICGDWNAGVSDIFGSLTSCRCQGDWGHHYTYWQADSSRIYKEAFANMFEASIGDGKKLEAMKTFFPTAYERFEYIIRSR